MAVAKDFLVEEKLVSLIALQKIDSKLDGIRVLKGELPMEVADLEDEITGLVSRKTRVEEEVNGMNKFIDTKRAAIADAKELIAKYEKQSGNVKNSREFDAINKEIEMQRLDVDLCEKHIRDTNEEMVDKTRKLETAKKAIAAKDAILSTKKGELEKIIAETEKEENHFIDIANEARKKVEGRLLASYERIRKNYRNGLAVVPVDRDACGGCFNAVPPQRQSEIKQRKKIIVCENCGRILVDDDLNASVEVK
jgi:uncharacterized protein